MITLLQSRAFVHARGKSSRSTGENLPGVRRGSHAREARLRSERQRLAALHAALRKAEGQTPPNQAEIDRLKQDIATLQKQIDEDEAALADVRIDFEMFCSG
jgi:septal ring factor EnvC (AmiA/AmiB activator)